MEALAGLQEAQGAAIGPLVAVLADPARAAEHANVRTRVGHDGPAGREPLVAVLQSADPKLMVQAILVLMEMGNREGGHGVGRPVRFRQKRRRGSHGRRGGAPTTHRARAHSAASPAAACVMRPKSISIGGSPSRTSPTAEWSCGNGMARSGNCWSADGTPADAARAMAAALGPAGFCHRSQRS